MQYRTPNVYDFLVSTDLPEQPAITENELRALEILLGTDLKRLLSERNCRPPKRAE
jgi:hypothetical protein